MKSKKAKTVLSVICTLGLLFTMTSGVPLTSQAAEAVPTESYNWQNAQIGGGGYVVDIVFNQKQKDLIYARTDMGGAYRYNTATNRWIPLTDMIGFDDWNNLGCDSIATDPVDPNRVYIAAGTYTNDWTASNGCILRSKDQGATWQVTQLPFKIGANMMGRSMGERLAIDPNSNNVLYMGTRNGNGLWKSIDYGETWSQVTSFTEVGDFAPTDLDSSVYDNTLTGVVWVTFDPTSSTTGTPCQTIYAGVANKAKAGQAAENTVYYSKDGGASWNPIAGQPKAGYFPHHGVLSSNGMLYIVYNNGVGPYDGTKGDVWKYNTKTNVWTQISPVASSSDDDYFGYGGISVDAQNPDTLIVTTLNSWWPDSNIYRSTDGGTTWTNFWSWNGYPNRTLRYTQDITASPWLTFGKQADPPTPSPKIGWMMGNISIDPFNSNRMFYSTGATVYSTNNLTDIDSGGKVNLKVNSLGIEQTAVLSLISPTTGSAHLVSGLGDVTGFVHEDLTKVPDMMMITPNFSSTTSMDYAELNPTKYVRVGNTDSGTSSRIGISYDSAKNWSAGTNCWSATSTDSTGGGKVAMSADGNIILWAPSQKAPCYSTTSGSSWTSCSGLPIDAAIASDRVNPKKFYGFSAGSFYVSVDGGKTFTVAATGLPDPASSASPETTPVNFKAMPGIEGDIWLAGGAQGEAYGLYHSTDSGKTFTKLDNVQEADVVGFGKAATGKNYMSLYISAKINGVRGIFRSNDVGQTWVRINDDAHQYGRTNMCITGDPRVYGRVYVGTNGRGIVYGDTTSTTPTDPEVTNAAISPSTASFDKNTQNQNDVSITMTLNGNTLTSITNGQATLAKDTDYSITDNTVVIKKTYLATLATGSFNFVFHFSAGDDQTLVVTIADTTENPTYPTQPSEPANISVSMFNKNLTAASNSISPQFQITNTGTSAIALSDLKVRYYFTKDGATSQNFWCDWANIGTSNVTGTFVSMDTAKDTADCYLEITFLSASGNLAAGESVLLQTRVSKSDWSNYNQANDYSYNQTATTYVSWDKVTAYVGNQLEWGTQP